MLASNKQSFFENVAGQVLEDVKESCNIAVESERLKYKLAFGRERSPPQDYPRVQGQTPPGPTDLLSIGLCLFRFSSVEGDFNTQTPYLERTVRREN